MLVAEERGFVLPNLHTQQIDKPRSKGSAETRSGRRRRRLLRQICWGGGLRTGVFVVGSEGWSFCAFLFPLASLLLLLLPPPRRYGWTDGDSGEGVEKILGW